MSKRAKARLALSDSHAADETSQILKETRKEMKRRNVFNITKNLTITERAQVAAALLIESCEREVKAKEEARRAKNENFWRLFDEFALEVLLANNNEMSLTKFENEMKARRFKTPKIDALKAHGYTVSFDKFFKISL